MRGALGTPEASVLTVGGAVKAFLVANRAAMEDEGDVLDVVYDDAQVVWMRS